MNYRQQVQRTPSALIVIVAVIFVLIFGLLVLPQAVRSLMGVDAPTPQAQSMLPTTRVRVNGHGLTLELATTTQEQHDGLSWRKQMGEDEGMLFVYPTATVQKFWMYGMQFPLDIIFLNDGRVISVAADLPAYIPGRFPTVVSSNGVADQVLELRAGRAKELGIEVGSNIQ